MKQINYKMYSYDQRAVIQSLGKERLLKLLREMLLIRNFEIRAESAYQQGKVGGFFHAYIGQEAIQTAAIDAIGKDSWWTTTYRCHAMSLLLGSSMDSVMAELYGKESGNALGRGGSMHLYADRMLGGFGIVGGHIPIATGAAFTIKYKEEDAISTCFMGDGAVAQGAFHESLNLASLFDLPILYIVENNQWGMGTAVSRAISFQPIAESAGPMYQMDSYTVDGMDVLACHAFFTEMNEKIKKKKRPVIAELMTERFRGHSISDPALYRSKEELESCMQKDPIHKFFQVLEKEGVVTKDEYESIDKEMRERAKEAMKKADLDPEPPIDSLEEGVLV